MFPDGSQFCVWGHGYCWWADWRRCGAEGTVIVGGLIGGDVGLRAEGTVIVGGLIGGDVGLRARLLLVG